MSEYIETRDQSEIQAAIEDGPAHLWVQWNGTNLCADVHCECGAWGHIDGNFLYAIKCAACGQVWTLGQNVELIKGNPNGYDNVATWVPDEDDAP
jgi:hypothetical protein